MSDFDYDHAVVGGGIVGSWTALHLVRAGKKILLLEQFSQPHTRGSSHGQSRVIRSCYAEEYFCEMMPHSLRMWRQAEAQSGKKLMENTGVLCIASSHGDADTFRSIVANMKHFCPGDLDEEDPRIASTLSRQLRYEDLHGILMDRSGGILVAHRAVLAVQALFREEGGHLWDNSPVLRLEPLGEEGVRLHLESEKIVKVRSVVVSAGAWTKELLSPHVKLPLQAAAVRVYYWKPKEADAYSPKSGFPTMIDIGEPNVYAMPSLEYPGLVKVCLHGGVDCDPDERDKTNQDPKLEESLRGYIKEHFPLLETEPAIVETCMYTLTPDEVFLIDTVPNHKNIVIGTGFSGTGFKTSPAVGHILSQMATGQKPFMDISPFRLSRFTDSK